MQEQGIIKGVANYLDGIGQSDLAQELGGIRTAPGMANFYEKLTDMRFQGVFGEDVSDHATAYREVFRPLWDLQDPDSVRQDSLKGEKGPFFGFSAHVTPTIDQLVKPLYELVGLGEQFDANIYDSTILIQKDSRVQMLRTWGEFLNRTRENSAVADIVQENSAVFDAVKIVVSNYLGSHNEPYPKYWRDASDVDRFVGEADDTLSAIASDDPNIQELKEAISQFRKNTPFGPFGYRLPTMG